jgi:hypothetical protein
MIEWKTVMNKIEFGERQKKVLETMSGLFGQHRIEIAVSEVPTEQPEEYFKLLATGLQWILDCVRHKPQSFQVQPIHLNELEKSIRENFGQPDGHLIMKAKQTSKIERLQINSMRKKILIETSELDEDLLD